MNSPLLSLVRRLILLIILIAAPASAALVGYWNFDNSGSLGADGSGNSNNLTPQNAAAYNAAGRNGGCVQLNGTNQFLSPTGALTNIPTGSSVYSIAAWIKTTVPGDRGILGYGAYGSVRQVNALRLMGGGGNQFRHYWWGADLDGTAPSTYTNNAWHHIVAVYNGSTRTLYFNGVQFAQDTPGLNGVPNTNNFRVGSTNNGEYFSGLLDDVAIWNSALTPAEITSLAGGALPPTVGNLPAISSFTATPQVFLPGQSVTLTWTTAQATSASINQGIGIVATAGSMVVTPSASTTYTLTATNVSGSVNASVSVSPLGATQLTNRWSFNEGSGTAVQDSAGTAHGTVLGSGWTRTATSLALPGGASATAPYVDLPNGLLSSKTDVTIEGWATNTGAGSWQRVFDFGTGTANEIFAPGGSASGTSYLLYVVYPNGNVNNRLFGIAVGGTQNQLEVADPAVAGQEFHFAVVYDSRGNGGQPQLRYYKNGVLTGSLNTALRLNQIVDVNNWLGRSNWTGDANFAGSYNEVRIWNAALNPSTVSDVYSLGPSILPTTIIDGFAANTTNITQGQTVRLSYVFSAPGGGTPTGAIDNGVGAVSGTSGFVDVVPQQTTTYTLTVTNGAVVRTATVRVLVTPSAPTVYDRNLSANYETATAVTLVATDPNTALGSLTYSIVTPPAHGSVSAGTGASRTYTPAAGYSGPDSFAYRANDGSLDSNIATVNITVNPAPAAAVAVVLDNTVVPTTAVAGNFIATIYAQDVNPGDTFTYTLVSGANSEENGNFTIVGSQLRAATAFSGLAGQPQRIRIRATDSGGNAFEAALLLSVAPASTGVVINEVLYNPVNNKVRTEFIELFNSSAAPVNLTGWRISGAADYVFPNGTTIAAGGYLVVAQDPAAVLSRWGVTALGPWSGALSSNGETIRLRNSADTVVSLVDYQVGFPWPVVADGEGTSMELLNPSLNPSLGSNWRPSAIPVAGATTDSGTPGAVNAQFTANAAPAIRDVEHSPSDPRSFDPIVITARVTDSNGVQSVQLQYQLVAPGTFLSSTTPRTISGGQFTGVNTTTPNPPLAANAAFENPANWTTAAMTLIGSGTTAPVETGYYTATIPAQPHRTLVRYRIVVTDNSGANARVPYSDDPSLNFACFVYNGVPSYAGTPPSELTTLPVYHFLGASADYEQCIAMGNGNAARLAGNTPSWTYENWEAAFVYNGKVYDHIKFRLHGANGRYAASGNAAAGQYGKRAFKFVFNKGAYFEGRDQGGSRYPTTWKTMITENLWENRGTQTFSLNEVVNFHIWNQLGVPSPYGHWAHFRTIKTGAEQSDQYTGDFWGLMYVHEDYDKQFLDAHELPSGNLFKLTRDPVSGVSQQRYQAPFAVSDGSDHDDLHNNLRGTSTPAYITGRVNLDLWCRYHAYAEAIRHYDYWPTGDNNAAWYFYPDYNAGNSNKGVLWWLPNDVDATWGPTWNNGHDLVHNSLFNDSASPGGDASTNPTLWPRYYNQIREIRDLLWQQDQIDPLIDQFAAVIMPFVDADYARWYSAPNAAGNHSGFTGPGMSNASGQISLGAYAADMKAFAWTGGAWGGGNVGAGGRAAFLDTKMVENGEGGLVPNRPTITHSGTAGFPVNDLTFTTSAFGDPQGAGTFAAIEWRVAEVNPTSSYVPGEPRLLEINAKHTAASATFASTYRFPATTVEPGKRYRARVRHQDTSGRWSRWSLPAEFTTTAVDTTVLANNLIISEIMYHATNPTPAEQSIASGLGQVWDDDSFDYIELRNIGASPLDIGEVRFSQGVNFTFPAGTTLAANATILIVHNTAAFNARYGSGKPVAGAWLAGNKLSNGGDQLNIKYGDAPTPFYTVTYDDTAPWPVTPDGSGPSLVLLAPETRPNPNLGTNWRASFAPNGTPGGDDRANYATWATANSAGILTADDDGDGIINLLEYALNGLPGTSSQSPLPTSTNPGGVLTLTFARLYDPSDVTYAVEFTNNLGTTPFAATGTLVSSVNNGNGTLTQTWQAPAAGPQYFGRVRVVKP